MEVDKNGGDKYNTKIAQIKEILNNERIKNKSIIEQLSKEIDNEEEENINLKNQLKSLKKELEQEKENNEKLNDKINNLINELNQEKENNQKLYIDNKNILSQLDQEKEATHNLLKKITKLNYSLDEEIHFNKKMHEKLKTYEASTNKNLQKIQELIDELGEKEQIIDRLRIKLARYPFDLATGERMMSVIFLSSDRRIISSIICKNTDEFSEIEEKLYKQYPQCRKYDICFRHRGKKINRYYSLENNKIYDNDMIEIEFI